MMPVAHPAGLDDAAVAACTSATQGRVPPWSEKKVRDSRLSVCTSDHDACRLAVFDPEDADTSVVPVSLYISMAVEGCHENRGLLPLSTSVRLL
jgi:hypothetical protein